MRFVSLAVSAGYEVARASRELDMLRHVDYTVRKGGIIQTVDVKARKRIYRRDENYNDKLVWIEIRDVNGNPGWLYGFADKIAFETKSGFVLVDRKKLIGLVKALTLPMLTDKPQVGKLYQRLGRKDIITIVEVTSLRSISPEYWF